MAVRLFTREPNDKYGGEKRGQMLVFLNEAKNTRSALWQVMSSRQVLESLHARPVSAWSLSR